MVFAEENCVGLANSRRVIAASALSRRSCSQPGVGADLGKIEEIMFDVTTGRIAYAVLSFGGFLGIGDKLFAVPWGALSLNSDQEFVLNVDRQMLESAPGFDKRRWPDMADPAFAQAVHRHYGKTPYWEHEVTDAGDYVGDNPQRNRSIEYEPATVYPFRTESNK